MVYVVGRDRKDEQPFDGLTVPIDAEMSTSDHMMRVEHNGAKYEIYQSSLYGLLQPPLAGSTT